MKALLTYSRQGLHLTEQFEGCRLVAYQDGKGIWTIGYGHTHGVFKGMTITQAQAEAFLLEDVRTAAAAVNQLVQLPLLQNEFDALVDFVFNLGIGTFTRSTLLRLLNQGLVADAANEFERFDMCGGQHVAGLLRRRTAEKAEFLGEQAA